MAQVRETAVAGQFYTDNPEKLKGQIKDYLDNTENSKSYNNSKVVIVPHAGYVFSGQIAADGISKLNKQKIKRVFILASAHHHHFSGVSAYKGQAYKTPLGNVSIDSEIVNKLISDYSFIDFIPAAHDDEHCIEVELPILKQHLDDFKIIPLLIGSYNQEISENLAKALEEYKDDDETAFVVSTDFSHYPDYQTAKKVDEETAEAIASGNPAQLLETKIDHKKSSISNLATDLCGWTSVLTVMNLFEDENYAWEIISSANSGDSPYGDQDRVVGYNSIIAYKKEKDKSEFSLSIKEKKLLLKHARKTLEHHFNPSEIEKFKENDFSETLKTECGAFVTLKKDGKLRGCIGNFTGNAPLHKITEEMALAAALKDSRFPELKESELNEIDIEISVLTPLKRIQDTSDLVLGKHGIYIKKGFSSGTFLPQVADDTGWTKEEFLGHCSRDKAGLGWEGWKDAELYTYEAIVFSEKEILE